MNSPLATIVIPAYNAGPYIERTLQSAKQQSYPNLEVIVVDDGSKDDTRAIAEAVAAKDSRFRVLSIPNGGVANARNVGTREAMGEYVAFLDADDLWHPKKVELQVEAMQHRVDGVLPAASYTLMRSIDENDRVTAPGGLLSPSGFVLARHFYFKPVGNGSSVLVRREVALELGGYDPSWAARGIGGCEDLDFELKVAAQYPMVAVPQMLIGYRRYEGNMSSNRVRMALGCIGVVQQHVKANPQLPAWAIKLAYASTYEYTAYLLLEGGHWALAMEHLQCLVRYAPRQAASVVVRSVRDELSRKLRKRRAGRSAGPRFDEMDPEDFPANAEARLNARKQGILARLTTLDAELGQRLVREQEQRAR